MSATPQSGRSAPPPRIPVAAGATDGRGSTTRHADLFPHTATWIPDRVREGGRDNWLQVNNHLMAVYLRPLRAYFLKTSFRNLDEPDDIINDFFQSRLSRPEFYDKWLVSGKRLRRWLMTSLCHFLLERYRAEKRARGEPIDDLREPAGDDPAPQRAMDLEFLQAVVRAALELAEDKAASAGNTAHWNLFRGYYIDRTDCKDLAAEAGVPEGRAWVMIRTAKRWFVAAVREVLLRDGVPEDQIDDEIRDMLGDAGL
jgi:DNA-directed RNA polymerase specialized sigma24 family protein